MDLLPDLVRPVGAANAFGLVGGTKNLPGPGKRPLSSMAPTIVLDHDGKVVLVLGSPGGAKIITAVLQVLSNVLDFKMPLEEAVGAPRFHHQWRPDELIVEEGVSRATVEELALKRGHVVRIVRRDQEPLGEVQAVQVLPSGQRVAATDPRGIGRPAVN